MKTDEDRIAELESTVSELEATVRGLTEELVDANERIRLLERAVANDAPEELSPASDEFEQAETADAGSADSEAEGPKTDESKDSETTENVVEDDDIIVA